MNGEMEANLIMQGKLLSEYTTQNRASKMASSQFNIKMMTVLLIGQLSQQLILLLYYRDIIQAYCKMSHLKMVYFPFTSKILVPITNNTIGETA